MADASKLLRMFMQEFGRAPKSADELSLFAQYKGMAPEAVDPKTGLLMSEAGKVSGQPGGVPQPPGPGESGFSTERIYEYLKGGKPAANAPGATPAAPGMSLLKRMIMIGGPIGAAIAGVYGLSELGDQREGLPSTTATMADGERPYLGDVSSISRDAINASLGVTNPIADRIGQGLKGFMTQRKMQAKKPAPAPAQPAVPQPPQAAPMMDAAALMELFSGRNPDFPGYGGR